MQKHNYLLISRFYPTPKNLYSGTFIHERVKVYQSMGLNTDVFIMTNSEGILEIYEADGIRIYRGGLNAFGDFWGRNGPYKKILIHFVSEPIYKAITALPKEVPFVVWVHAYEVQAWYRRWYNIDLNRQFPINMYRTIRTGQKQIAVMKNIFSIKDRSITFIFVSEWIRRITYNDVGVVPDNSIVIPNYIDTVNFQHIPKNESDRLKILNIRPYSSRNYANDRVIKTILYLSKKPYFKDLSFTLYGDGYKFERMVKPLRGVSNVRLHKRFLTHDEISSLHKVHGIYLCPTRTDSHPVSISEAMSSGLVPMINKVAGVPEYIDDSCGILARSHSYKDFVSGIEFLYRNPEVFKKLSLAAAGRVRVQCNKENTIIREIAVIKH